MFKSVILPFKFDCFVGWVVGVGVLTLGRGVLRPGNSWWGCAAGSLNPDPISDQKLNFPHPFSDLVCKIRTLFQTWSLKSIPVFRPGLWGIMSSLLRLERRQKTFKLPVEFAYFSVLSYLQKREQKSSSNPFRILIFFFLLYSFGIETFIQFRSSLKIHTRFQTKMGKVYNRFQTKTAQNPTRWGGKYLYRLYKGVFPPGFQRLPRRH